MTRTRISAILALAAQAAFGCMLSFLPWTVAALISLGLALVALGLRLSGLRLQGERLSAGRGAFPRLHIASLLVFLAMSALGLFLGGDTLFPYTGVFFGAGLGCACMAELAFTLA